MQFDVRILVRVRVDGNSFVHLRQTKLKPFHLFRFEREKRTSGLWDNNALENQGYCWANHARPGESKAEVVQRRIEDSGPQCVIGCCTLSAENRCCVQTLTFRFLVNHVQI